MLFPFIILCGISYVHSVERPLAKTTCTDDKLINEITTTATEFEHSLDSHVKSATPSCGDAEVVEDIRSHVHLHLTNVRLFTPYNRTIGSRMLLSQAGGTRAFLKSSKFDPRLETKFILPGLERSIDQYYDYHDCKDALLDHGVYNVFIVDYYGLTGQKNVTYETIVYNSHYEAKLIARFICHIQIITGISPMSIHLIGEGIGAHIAGNIGARIPNLGRISGLDPSHMYFYTGKVADSVRLDPSDALQVDCIHTSADEKLTKHSGTMIAGGHIDFYPNGGRDQPGCVEHDELCDTRRAMLLYINSIKHRCCLVGEVCCDWDSYVTGRCYVQTPKKIEMGFNTIVDTKYKDGLRVCLRTRAETPYCNQVWIGSAEKPTC